MFLKQINKSNSTSFSSFVHSDFQIAENQISDTFSISQITSKNSGIFSGLIHPGLVSSTFICKNT
ncbi:hypothetical protein ACFLY2_01570 [Patescibacteria group bacterium]